MKKINFLRKKHKKKQKVKKCDKSDQKVTKKVDFSRVFDIFKNTKKRSYYNGKNDQKCQKVTFWSKKCQKVIKFLYKIDLFGTFGKKEKKTLKKKKKDKKTKKKLNI